MMKRAEPRPPRTALEFYLEYQSIPDVGAGKIRWDKLPMERRQLYENLAATDRARYDGELKSVFPIMMLERSMKRCADCLRFSCACSLPLRSSVKMSIFAGDETIWASREEAREERVCAACNKSGIVARLVKCRVCATWKHSYCLADQEDPETIEQQGWECATHQEQVVHEEVQDEQVQDDDEEEEEEQCNLCKKFSGDYYEVGQGGIVCEGCFLQCPCYVCRKTSGNPLLCDRCQWRMAHSYCLRKMHDLRFLQDNSWLCWACEERSDALPAPLIPPHDIPRAYRLHRSNKKLALKEE